MGARRRHGGRKRRRRGASLGPDVGPVTRGHGGGSAADPVVAADEAVSSSASPSDPSSDRVGVDRAAEDLSAVGCVICGGADGVGRFHMTHRVEVVLCRAHRDPGYLGRDGGRAFTGWLDRVWRGHGVLTSARRAALRAHRRRFGARPDRSDCPGSYSWPELRLEAERRFAGHEDPRAVIADLRVRHRDDRARVPSVQTMRRWFREGRWLDGDRRARGGRRRVSAERRPRNRLLAAVLGQRPRRTWYTPSGKPPCPWRHLTVPGMSMDVFHPWGAIFFDMSRREPDEDDFGTRWKHGSS